ncbi:hypothetical protein GCM10009037_07040 [Halarchaeum grantii]|uniref:CARDB protein n=1 Tax=Halarchaeum grantii TaxID=1193105 RepID=A0A830EST3_9EURY|nr:hypothetical protein [Halarchaeum grantii]GGL25996.1 hypothetical protein GCM10009037_07040 [Halarchaeum grantii]
MVRFRAVLLVTLIGAMVLTAGCSGVLDSGPSVSNTQTQLTEYGPAIEFNYSVSDYSQVLLQRPDGEVVTDDTIEPNQSSSALLMGDPQPGTYKLIVQQGGETVVTKEVTFDGPNAHVREVNANWSGSVLHDVSVTIENTGDLPFYVKSGTVSVRDASVNGSLYEWIPANTTETVTVSPSFGALVVEESGDVRGQVSIRAANETFTDTFAKSFEGPNLKVVNTSSQWNGDTLTHVTATVKNTGDMGTTATAAVYHGEEQRAIDGFGTRIAAGETVQYDISSFSYIYRATSGGDVDLSLVVNSSAGFTTTPLSHSVTGADVTITSLTPNWQNGVLQNLKFTATNEGDVESEFTAYITVGGEEIASPTYRIGGGETATFSYGDGLSSGYGPIYTVTSGGDVDVTVSVSTPGSTGTSEKTASASFEDVSASINADATFYEQMNGNDYELSSLDVDIQNTGGLPVSYDSIEIEVDGATRSESLYSTQSIASGSSATEYLSFTDAIVVSDGSHDVTIRLKNGGETVLSDTVTVST